MILYWIQWKGRIISNFDIYIYRMPKKGVSKNWNEDKYLLVLNEFNIELRKGHFIMTCAPHKVGPGGPKAFDMDASKPPACYFWNIAEKNCDGVKVLITPTQFRNMNQLYTSLASKVGCGGGVRGVYSPTGHAYKDLSEFKDGDDVVVVPTGDVFSKSRIPVKLAAKIGK